MSITKYNDICIICGGRAEATHHLIFGRGMRNLAESDNIKAPVCNRCHNMAQKTTGQIHENATAEALSKIAGQLAWEKEWICKHAMSGYSLSEDAREKFRQRYGVSYL